MRFTFLLICALSLFPLGIFAQESKSTSIDPVAFANEWREVKKLYPNVSAALVQWQGISTQGITTYSDHCSVARNRICTLCRAPSFTIIKKKVAIERAILITQARFFTRVNACLKKTMECAGPNIPWDCEPNGDDFKACIEDVESSTNSCPDWCPNLR